MIKRRKILVALISLTSVIPLLLFQNCGGYKPSQGELNDLDQIVTAQTAVVIDVVEQGGTAHQGDVSLDATADDTESIQKSLDMLPTGGTIQFQPGTYRIRDFIYIRNSNIKLTAAPGAQVTIVGPAWEQVALYPEFGRVNPKDRNGENEFRLWQPRFGFVLHGEHKSCPEGLAGPGYKSLNFANGWDKACINNLGRPTVDGKSVQYGISELRRGSASITLSGYSDRGLSVGDMVMISEFPEDPADAPIRSESPPFDMQGPFLAFQSAVPVKRHLRKQEFSVVESIDASGHLTLRDRVLFDYGREGLALYKIKPVSGITFSNLKLSGIAVNAYLTKDITFQEVTAYQLGFRAASCYKCSLQFPDFDAGGRAAAVDFSGGSRRLDVRGRFRNYAHALDGNALVKFMQVADSKIDVDLDNITAGYQKWNDGPDIGECDWRNSDGTCRSEGAFGVMIDTNFINSPLGYTDAPLLHVDVKVRAKNCKFLRQDGMLDPKGSAFGLVVSSYSFNPIRDVKIEYENSDGTCPLNLRGTRNVLLRAKGLVDLFFEGAENTVLIDSQVRTLTAREFRREDGDPSYGTLFKPAATTICSINSVLPTTGVPARSCRLQFFDAGINYYSDGTNICRHSTPGTEVAQLDEYFLSQPPIDGNYGFFETEGSPPCNIHLGSRDGQFNFNGKLYYYNGKGRFCLSKSVVDGRFPTFFSTTGILEDAACLGSSGSTSTPGPTSTPSPTPNATPLPVGEFVMVGELYFSNGSAYCKKGRTVRGNTITSIPAIMANHGICSPPALVAGEFRFGSEAYYSNGKAYCRMKNGSNSATVVVEVIPASMENHGDCQ